MTDKTTLLSVLAEAEFFGIKDLMKVVELQIDDDNTHECEEMDVKDEDRQIRNKMMEKMVEMTDDISKK